MNTQTDKNRKAENMTMACTTKNVGLRVRAVVVAAEAVEEG